MPALAFTDQAGRLRRTLQRALDGAAYESSRTEAEGMVVLMALRADGRRIGVRFRGVRSSESSAEPEAGARLRLRGVHAPFSFGSLFMPRHHGSAVAGYQRVRIEAGAAHLDIVCQDAEWWEADAPAGQEGA